MTDRSLRILLTGSAAGAVRAFEEAGAAAETSAGKMGKTFDGATSKVGGLFEKLGSQMQSFGIPFSGVVSDIGKKFDETSTKGQKLHQVVSSIGGAALGIGVAGFVAVGAESVHMADQFDVAQTQLQTAIKNSGNSWDAYKGKVDDLNAHMAKLGFQNTEVESSLATLTTATNDPAKAMSYMGLAANLARQRNMSLSDATGLLAKSLAGSSRAIKQMGLNLNIGSGNLHSIQSATMSLAGAQRTLKQTQQEVADGTLKGAKANAALWNAQVAVRQDTLKLKQSQGAIATIMSTLQQRTKGAADAYGKTLKGEMAAAGAQVHNLGVSFGEWLVPKLTLAAQKVSELIGWFQKHKAVAEALAYTIGAVLGVAITVFVVNKIASFVKATGEAIKSVTTLTAKMFGTAAATDEASSSFTAATEAGEGVVPVGTEIGTSFEAAGSGADAASGSFDLMGAAMDALPIFAVITAATLLITHWKLVTEVLSKAWHWISGEAVKIWNGIKTFFKNWWPLVLGIFTGGIGLLIGEIIQHWTWVKKTTAKVWSDILGFFKKWWPEILGAFTLGIGLLIGLIVQHWNSIKSTTISVWNSIVGFFKAIPGKILGFFEGLADKFWHIGSDIVHGIWNGIESGAGWLWDKIKGVAKGIVHAFTDPLSILSPSRVMADSVGKPIMAGVAKGIDDGFGQHVKPAIGRAVAGIQAGFKTGTIAPVIPIASAAGFRPVAAAGGLNSPTTGPGAVPTTAGRNITTNVYVTHPFDRQVAEYVGNEVGWHLRSAG